MRPGRAAPALAILLSLTLGSCASSSDAPPLDAGDPFAGYSSGKESNTMAYSKDCLVIAHRGFRGLAPENTLLAARKGFEAGAPWWELDVAASSDGFLVVIHDDTLPRTTDVELRFPERKPWSVYDFSLAELKSLDAGSWYAETDPFKQIALGKLSDADLASFAGERIPSLREALELTKREGKKVNVEIKDATGRGCDPWIVERTVELVRELGMVKDVLISSFNHEYLRRVRRAEPGIRIGALVDEEPKDPVAILKDLGAFSYHPGKKYLTEAAMRAVRAAGYEVYVWTANDTADMEKVLAWGATGLITDFPDRAFGVLGRR